MKPHWHRWWRLAVISSDVVFVTAALTAVAVARFGPQAFVDGLVPAPGRDFAQAPLAFAIPTWILVFASLRLYNPQRCQNGLQEARRLVTASLGTAVALVMLGFLVKENPARSWLFASMVLGTLTVAIGRQTVRSVATRLRRSGRWMTPTVVVGHREAKRVVEAVLASPGSGIQPVATCGFSWPGVPSFSVEEAGEAVQETCAAEVVVVAEDLSRGDMATVVEVGDEFPVSVVVLPGLDHLLVSNLQLVTVVHEPGLSLEGPSLRTWQRAAKRVADVVVASVSLLVMAPVMGAIAIAIRLDSPGLGMFRQKREGWKGRTFEAFKFRTMRDGCEDDEAIAGDDLAFLSKPEEDVRVTRVGRMLRRTSLDELPQLWNILRGDMSLVGPRPLPLREAERLGIDRRLIVRPGLTGLWQVSGRSSLSPEERIRLDLVYVQNWSLLLDLSILLRTVPAVIGGNGAY